MNGCVGAQSWNDRCLLQYLVSAHHLAVSQRLIRFLDMTFEVYTLSERVYEAERPSQSCVVIGRI